MTLVDKKTISEHGLIQTLKIYLDSLDDKSYEQKIQSDPFLRDMVKAANYERKK